MKNNIKDSTKDLKNAVIALHKICQDIERKSEKDTSKELPDCINDFNKNMSILTTSTRDLEVFQADVVNKLSCQPTEVRKRFKRQMSFRVFKKQKTQEDISSRDQKTGTNIEDNNQYVEPNFKRRNSDYSHDKKKRRQLEINEIQKRNSELEAILKDKENELRNMGQSLDRTRWEAKDLRTQLSNCRRELTTERTEKDKTKAELEDALTRLSAIASSKLRDNNPNVVDLSDQNRPSKIAEQLSELYDNEWTVAYEVLEDNLSEKECIAALLKMLLDVYNECNQLATNGFYERVQQSIESPFPTKNKSVGTEVKMSDYLKQQIKELRKYRAKFAIEGITKVVAPKIQGDKVKDTGIQAYICKCVNICWYMVVQDPPLVFSCGSSGAFDTNVFRSYTNRGPYVDYVVWPALLVSDGSMLSKGIAQGCTQNVDTVSSTDV